MAKFYTAPDGTRYPLSEAKYNMSFKVYRSDRRKARIGDPGQCLLALGIRRDKDVLDVYIGSGRDAYVIFKAQDGEPAHAVHFTIPTTTRRIIDAFDKDRLGEDDADRTQEANGRAHAGSSQPDGQGPEKANQGRHTPAQEARQASSPAHHSTWCRQPPAAEVL
jgi:hypothetical protein